MQRITIPVYFESEQTEANSLAGKPSKPADYIVKPARISLALIAVFYERTLDGKPSGSIIETPAGNYSTPLTPDELDDHIMNEETDEFVKDLNRAGLKGMEDLIPGTFNDEINNMLSPNDIKPREPEN